jgi:hypothetical protein
VTRKEKLLAVAKNALYEIARNETVNPAHVAQRALGNMARIKAAFRVNPDCKKEPAKTKGGR